MLYWNLFLWVFLKIWCAGIWWADFIHSVQRCHNFIECTILAFFANGWGLFSFFRSSLSTVLIFLIVFITLIFWLHFIFLLVYQWKPYSQMGNKRWNSLEAPDSVLFPWDLKSTYIRCPSFFDKLVSTALLFNLSKIVRKLKKPHEELITFNIFYLLDQRASCTPAYWKCPCLIIPGRLYHNRSYITCWKHR